MGSALGVEKTAATRVGISLEEYRAHVAGGERWCTGCRAWHPTADFHLDRARGSRLKAKCKRWHRGRPWIPADPEHRMAREAVRQAIRDGLIPPPNAVACIDCGHVWQPGQRRHEYDHARGYATEHRLDVVAVCTTCHADREKTRREAA